MGPNIFLKEAPSNSEKKKFEKKFIKKKFIKKKKLQKSPAHLAKFIEFGVGLHPAEANLSQALPSVDSA